MRIVPYDGDEGIEDLDTIGLLIKAIPFEDGFVPAYSMIAPSDDYFIKIDEVNCLIDGIEIARDRLDNLIAMMLQSKIAEKLMEDSPFVYDQDDEEDEDDDYGEGD